MKLFRIALVLAALLAFTAVAVSDGNVQAQAAEEKKTVKDYESYYSKYKAHSEKLTNVKSWESVSLTHKETGKSVAWKEVPEKDRRLVVLMFAERISHEMKTLQGHWVKEAERLKAEEKDKEKKEEDKEEIKPATLSDVESYTEKLVKLRKVTAVKYEKMAESFFKDFEKDFTKDEIERHLRSIREWHDEEKLIERKK